MCFVKMIKKKLIYYIELFSDPFFNADHNISLTYEYSINLTISKLYSDIHLSLLERDLKKKSRVDREYFKTNEFLKKTYTFSLLDFKKFYNFLINHNDDKKFINYTFENKETHVYTYTAFKHGKKYKHKLNTPEIDFNPTQLHLPNNKEKLLDLFGKSVLNYQKLFYIMLYYENNKWNS